MWRPDPARLEEAAAWCRARGVPPAVVLPAGDAAALAGARAAGFRRRLPFEAAPLPPGRDDPAVTVEQAPWSRTREAGRLLGRRYRRPAFALAIAATLSDAMQRDPALRLWLAHGGGAGDEEVVGALVAVEAEGVLLTLLEAGPLPPLQRRAGREAAAVGLAAWRLAARAGGAAPARGLLRLERADERP